jgi:predicted enzyme related to lactoylglutathione lyase
VASRLAWICIDTTDAERLARFWGPALGWETIPEGDDVVVQPPPDSPDRGRVAGLNLLHVPEAKAVKNRLHLDLVPDDHAAEVARLEALGATRTSVGQGDVSWVVLADPEGNEFCVLDPASDWVVTH